MLVQNKDQIIRSAIKAICFFIAFQTTVFFIQSFKLNIYESVSLVGFIGSFNPFNFYLSKEDISNLIYSGSFTAMASSIIFINLHWAILTSIIAALIYKKSREVFIGYGGRLGTITFLSSTLTIFIHFLVKSSS